MQINSGNLTLVVIGCVCLCGVGFMLVAGFHVLTGFLGVFSTLIDVISHVIAGGPVAWCGCLVLIFVCGGGAALALIIAQGLSSCGTAQAINFCALFGQ